MKMEYCDIVHHIHDCCLGVPGGLNCGICGFRILCQADVTLLRQGANLCKNNIY